MRGGYFYNRPLSRRGPRNLMTATGKGRRSPGPSRPAAAVVLAALAVIFSAGGVRASSPRGKQEAVPCPSERGAFLSIPDKAAMRLYLASVQALLDASPAPGGGSLIWPPARQALSLVQSGHPRAGLEKMARAIESGMTGGGSLRSALLSSSSASLSAAVEQGIVSSNVTWLSFIYPQIRERALEGAGRLAHGPASDAWKYLASEAGPRADGSFDGPSGLPAESPWETLRLIRSAAEAARFLVKFDDALRLESSFEECRDLVLQQARLGSIPAGGAALAAVFPSPLINPLDISVDAALADPRLASASDPEVLLLLANARLSRGEQAKAVSNFRACLDRLRRSGGGPGADRLLPCLSLYVTTLRNMLIREDGGNLHLLSSVPPEWLEPGSTIRADGFPTCFGDVSLLVEARDREIVISFSRPLRIDPERVLVHLPDSLEITRVGRCGRSMRMWGTREVLVAGSLLNEITELKIGIKRRPK